MRELRGALQINQKAGKIMKLNELSLKEQVVEAMSRVYGAALTTTSGGNISACNENGTIYITPSGIDKGSLTAEDIAVVAPDGTVSGRYAPSMELPFHGDVYRSCKDVKAVVHAHSPAIVAYACMRKAPSSEYARVYEEALGKIVGSEYALPGSLKLGGIVKDRFAEGYRTVMMDNHGATVGAADMGKALAMYETLDSLTQALFYAAALGGAKTPKEKIALKKSDYAVEKDVKKDSETCESIVKFIKRAYSGKLAGNGYGTMAVKAADGIYFNPDGAAPMDLTDEDVTRYSDGKLSAPEKCRYLDMILKIFEKNPEARAVFVSAPAAAMAFALAHEKFDARLIPESYIMLRDVGRMPYSAIADYDEIASKLTTSAPVLIVDNECVVTIGKNVTKAFDRMEVLDYSARSVIAARPVAAITAINDEQVEEINSAFNGW